MICLLSGAAFVGYRGPDVAQRTLEKISNVLEARYAITIKIESVVHGATDDEAKGFIRSQRAPMFLLKHVSELVGDTTVNMASAASNEDELLPRFFALDISTFAHSAPAKSSSSSNKKDTSTQDRRPNAGFSFGMMDEVAAKHSPKHICVEVVPGIGQNLQRVRPIWIGLGICSKIEDTLLGSKEATTVTLAAQCHVIVYSGVLLAMYTKA
jgi:hypothetical protein